jgi:hypothetical protein
MSLFNIEDDDEVCECGDEAVYKLDAEDELRCLVCHGLKPDSEESDEFSEEDENDE